MLELKLEKYAKILLSAVPFLALIFIEGFYFPFIITRTAYFRLLIELVLSLYLLLLALNFKKYKPRLNWALGLTAVFLLVQLTAAVFGLNFYKSFWSDFERMEGVVSLVYLTAYLFLLQIFLKRKSDWLYYIRLILISSFLVSFYGLAQKFNLLPVFEAGIGRATSTIGNAAFLAGYLLLALGLGVYYYFNETDKKYRGFALAASAINLAVLLFTSTRGAILGLAIGLLVFLAISAIFASGKTRKISLSGLAALAVLAAGFFLFRSRLADFPVDFVSRMATISWSDGTVVNRLTVWRMALNDFKFHPWLGAGMENFEVIYNKYYRPDISENWFDRTHNVYLDQLMAGGVIGLGAYLAILFYLFFRLYKKRREDYWQFAVLTSLLAGYAIHNFFVFDTINTSFLYFFLIGLVSFRKNGGAGEINSSPDIKAFNYAFIALIIVNIFAFYKLVYLPVKINRAIYIGYYYVLADGHRSYENFKTALNYKLGSVEAVVQLNKMYDVLDEGGLNPESRKKYFELTEEKLRQVSLNFPLDIKTKLYLAQLILNNSRDENKLKEAENLIKETIKLSPTRVEPYYLLYNLYAKRGNQAEARAVLEDLIDKLPWYGGAKIMLMGEVAKDEPKRAEELFQAGVKQFGYSSYGGLIKIISYLLDQKRYGEAVPFYNTLIEYEPKRYDYRLDLAKVFYLSGDLDGAVDQLNLINANSPETLKGSEAFVNTLYEAAN